MMYKPITIANFFIEKSMNEGRRITPMKALKLVYIAHGWYLALTGKMLIIEQTEAWKLGPVISSLYRRLRIFGNGDIPSLQFADETDKNEYDELLRNSQDVMFLNRVWQVYKAYNGPQLSTLTHEEETPWYKIWHQEGGSMRRGAIIPNELIKAHYRSKVKPA